jgi:D-beta-D-heptose 7-phosphate kinase/D-beta-D-heptose 1-phosphate adenosyltransferase
MLDRYTWGNAVRVSPEAPVLVLQVNEQELRAGGAASVATLLRHLGAHVTLAGVVGNDPSGRALANLLKDEEVVCECVLQDGGRPTTTKERFLGRAAGRQPHQILRVDHEITDAIADDLVARLQQGIFPQLQASDVVVISDYAKGTCTAELVKSTISRARELGVPVIVDPARIDDYHAYAGASLITPNRMEAELVGARPVRTPEDGIRAGEIIAESFDIETVFVTMDRDGIAVIDTKSNTTSIEPARPRAVCDITGAGDMVVAIASLCWAAKLTARDAARLANVAAGLEVERIGVCPISWQEIEREIRDHGLSATPFEPPPSSDQLRVAAARLGKVLSVEEAAHLSAQYQENGKQVVFTNGCFDLLHVGHVSYLEEASKLGDVLFVAINSDAGVRRIKGLERPVVNEQDRVRMLASLAFVDHVLIFDEDTPHGLLRKLRPNVLVKGGTYLPTEVVGREIVEEYGGRVCVTDKIDGVSTTELLASIRGG